MLKNSLESQYNCCVKSMFKLRRFGIKLGLSTIKYILNELGNPQNSFYSIHIAGTNGKGSVASALAKILQESGYSVGLYTSPHLVKFNERICVNNVMISNKAVIEIWEVIKSLALNDREATFFELVTAMAFFEFKRRKVQYAVIETGMGGMQDATNVISPILSIITNISMEHKEHLGSNISHISSEKAGIIKYKVPVITGVSQKDAISVLCETANKMNSELWLKGRDFKTRKNKDGFFTYKGKYNRWDKMSTNLMGNHQINNAALVLAACEIMNQNYSIKLPLTCIRSGLLNNNWQGRLEVVLKSPKVILDGAHNLIAARNLSRFLKFNMTGKKITLVIGILDDKPYKAMLKNIVSHCFRIIVTQPQTDRALTVNKMRKAATLFSDRVEGIPNVGEALLHAIQTSAPDDVVCVAGSLYVVGEAKIKLSQHYNIS